MNSPFKTEPAGQYPHQVIAISGDTATLQRGKNTVKITNSGYTIGQTVLFDGSTASVIPAEVTVINI